MKTSIRSGERYFGVEITPDGRLIVAERAGGQRMHTSEFPGGEAGARALREHIEQDCAHPHVCIKACGAAGLALAMSLGHVPGVEVTLVSAPFAYTTPSSTPQGGAERLARLAERLF